MCQTIKENHQMSVEDLKVYLGGLVVYLAIDYSKADQFLKFILTAILIIFTFIRGWIALDEYLVRRKERKNNKNKKDETEQKED
jgi:hypothetical protein